MAVNRVDSAGSMVRQQQDGRYRLHSWFRLEGGAMHEEDVADLSWTEVCDCMLTTLDGCRPGWALGDGWRQPALDEALDALEFG